ncbi:MAG: universal stress protein [Cyclobacteriaceae bacterium]
MFKQILIPTDFSPAAWKAVEVGLNLCDQYDCEISILHIYPVASKFSKESSHDDLLPKLDKVKEHMIKLSNDLKTDENTKINNLVVPGNIEKQLMDFVNQHSFDLVIVGVNSTGEDNSPGSHTAKLIEESRTPVLVIPNNYSPDV